jgi:hypothetical protein
MMYRYIYDYFHTKFHVPGSSDSLVIAIKPQAKKMFALLPCCHFGTCKNIIATKVVYIFKVCYHPLFQDT